MDYNKIIDKYYPEEKELKKLLIRHSRDVADRALSIADKHPELDIDRQFLEEGAMLHDIGIFMTDAPGIHCMGKDPYIRHGIDGAELLRKEGYPEHARVCERHTGAGISLKQIKEQNLPLPEQDFLPETLEEKIICYADKFYSKSSPDKVKTLEKAERSVAKHGEDGLKRFKEWEKMFE
ncbi:MAG: HDIG domain-containing protein [Prevotellaceae bacterium]|nr:HDIG domain-containing protein [Prevotellaceae bacterium]